MINKKIVVIFVKIVVWNCEGAIMLFVDYNIPTTDVMFQFFNYLKK